MHIKKKYLQELLPFELSDLTKLKGGKFVSTLDGGFVRVFSEKLKRDGKEVLLDLPIPDLTLVYFNMAYLLGKERESLKEKLGTKLNSIDLDDEDVSNELYSYFGVSCSCIILAITSLESFMSSILPENAVYKRKNSEKEFNRDEIQLKTSFKEKINYVLPLLTGKGMKDIPESIVELQKLRNNIVHTKSNVDLTMQEQLMREVLNFDFERSLDDIREFMNFYKPDYVIDCECSKEF